MKKVVIDGLVQAMMHCRKQDQPFDFILQDVAAGKLDKDSLVQMPVKDVVALIAFYKLGAKIVVGYETVSKEELAVAILMNASTEDLVDVFSEMVKGDQNV